MTDRQFDLVLFGATGFTGGLVADYLANAAPADLRIALAGRDVAALAGCRDRLPGRAQGWGVLPGDAGDPAGLARLAESTRLVLTTVGPYARLGMPMVTACVQARTDYVDLAGEVPFPPSRPGRARQAPSPQGCWLLRRYRLPHRVGRSAPSPRHHGRVT